MKICVVSSCGGHLTEAMCLLPAFAGHECVLVLNDFARIDDARFSRIHFIAHAERDWRVLVNFWEAWVILRRERPAVIFSTGAGPAVPFALIGRWLFASRIVFVETITRVRRPSLSGRIMYRLAHEFYYQWPGLARFYPRGIYRGQVV